MQALGTFIVNWRISVSIALALLTLFLGWRATLLEENLSFETLYLSNSEDITFSNTFARTFENVNDLIAIAITGGDVFSRDCLAAIDEITKRIERIDQVDVVYSLSNSRYIEAKDGALDIGQFLEDLPDSAEKEAALLVKALSYDLFRGRMVSEDGKYIAIAVQIADLVGQPIDTQIAQLFEQLASESPQERSSALKSLSEQRSRVESVLKDNRQVHSLFRDLLSGPEAKQIQAQRELTLLGRDVVMVQTVEHRRELIARIEGIIKEELPDRFAHYVTGTNVIERDYARILSFDKLVFHILTALIIILGLYISLRSIRDVVISLIALSTASVCALGTAQLMGGVIDIINSVILVMVFVVGTSDVIHMMLGFYREWDSNDGPQAGKLASIRMVKSVGYACLLTSLTTSCGFFSLYFAEIGTISQFGLNLAAAVMVTYAVSLVSMALLLSLVKTAPLERSTKASSSLLAKALEALGKFVVDSWKFASLICFAAVMILSYGYQHLYVETHAVSEVPESSPTMVNIRATENLAGWLGFEVSVKATAGNEAIDPEVLRGVDKIVQYLRSQPETLRAWSVVDYIKTMNQAAEDGSSLYYSVPDSAAAVEQYLLFYSFSTEGSNEMKGLISQDRKWIRIVARLYDVGASNYLDLKDRVLALEKDLFPNGKAKLRVTSEMYLCHTAMDRIVSDLARSMIYAFVLVSLLMAFCLRSMRLGLVALLPNVIPVLATLGFMGLTGIELRVGTIVVFSLGLGIAVDDTIHYLLRYSKERALSGNYRQAIIRTNLTVGKPMVITSLVLVFGFLGTGTATFKSIWQMGVLNSFTIMLALVTDLLLTPVLLRLTEDRSPDSAPHSEKSI